MISTVLADLLSTRAKRARFVEDRETFLADYRGLGPDETAALLDIDAVLLDRQARQLIAKRMHEAAKLIPRTRRHLGKVFESFFFEYAESFHPKGHQRHLIDAVTFLRWLASEQRTPIDELERCVLETLLEPKAARLQLRIRALRSVFTRSGVKRGVTIMFRSQFTRTYYQFFYL